MQVAGRPAWGVCGGVGVASRPRGGVQVLVLCSCCLSSKPRTSSPIRMSSACPKAPLGPTTPLLSPSGSHGPLIKPL